MDDDRHPRDRAQTSVKFSLTIGPVSHADERVTGLLSTLLFDLANLVGCSRKTASQVNVQSVEETTAILEENLFSSGELKLDMAVVGEKILIHSAVLPAEVEIPGTESWFQPDEPQRDMSKEPLKTIRRKRSELLADTVRERRVDRTKGGLFGPKGDDGKGGGSEGEGGSSAPTATVVPLRKKPS